MVPNIGSVRRRQAGRHQSDIADMAHGARVDEYSDRLSRLSGPRYHGVTANWLSDIIHTKRSMPVGAMDSEWSRFVTLWYNVDNSLGLLWANWKLSIF